MEEVEVLADRICVLAKGHLKYIGSSFYLKQLYGDGHRILINLKRQEDESLVVRKIKNLCRAIQLVDYRGGSLILATTDYNELLHLVRKL